MHARGSSYLILAVASLGWVACGGSSSALDTTNSALGTEGAVGVLSNFGPNLQTAGNGACRQPEGLTADPEGNLWVASNSDSATTVGHVCKLSGKDGALLDIIDVPSGPANLIGLLGEIWENGRLLVLDQADDNPGNGRLLRIDPNTHAVTVLDTGMQFPNGLVEDHQGHLYVTDSILGTIFKFNSDGSHMQAWLTDPLLATTNPNLPVGANGIALDADGDQLVVANSGNSQVLHVRINEDGTAGAITVAIDGPTIDQELGLPSPTALFGADGLQLDDRGNVMVACNHANELQLYSREGRLLHRYAGSGNTALDFPASPWFIGDDLFVTSVSGFDGGGNSKVSRMEAPFRGAKMY